MVCPMCITAAIVVSPGTRADGWLHSFQLRKLQPVQREGATHIPTKGVGVSRKSAGVHGPRGARSTLATSIAAAKQAPARRAHARCGPLPHCLSTPGSLPPSPPRPQANAPAIAAAASGAAAAKVAYDKRDSIAKGGRGAARGAGAGGGGEGRQQVARMVVGKDSLPPVVALTRDDGDD